jgi:hypothetical protein
MNSSIFQQKNCKKLLQALHGKSLFKFVSFFVIINALIFIITQVVQQNSECISIQYRIHVIQI